MDPPSPPIQVLTPLSEGVDPMSVLDSLEENFLPVMQSEWSVFLPYNLVAFAFLPSFIRPFTTGFVSMLFSTYLSWITHLEPKVQAHQWQPRDGGSASSPSACARRAACGPLPVPWHPQTPNASFTAQDELSGGLLDPP